MKFSFLRDILLLSAILALIVYYPISRWMTSEDLSTVVASGIIAFLNTIIGWVLLEFSINKSNSVFMIAVFGGMGVRMMLILVVFAILLSVGHDSVVLALSLMAFYFIYMIAEIIYAMKVMSKRKADTKAKSVAPNGTMIPRTLIIEQAKR